jgi:hypothetical protein
MTNNQEAKTRAAAFASDHVEAIDAEIYELERKADQSADVCNESRIAYEATIERQKIVYEGIRAQVAILEETKTRLLATTGASR